MDKSRVEPTIFFIEKISFSLKLFSGHFYGQSFIKTVRGPLLSAEKQQNLKLLSAANYRWRFMGKISGTGPQVPISKHFISKIVIIFLSSNENVFRMLKRTISLIRFF